MDSNHPIPQDVTGFQFRLIGDMTVKQFAYVAAGSIVAFALFYAPISPFIKYPLAIIPAAIGAALAFLPIGGRPLDAMASYFIKALVTPNQYAYHKTGGVIALFAYQAIRQGAPGQFTKPSTGRAAASDPAKALKLQQYLRSVHTQPASSVDEKEELFLQHITLPSSQGIASSPNPSPSIIPAPMPTPQPPPAAKKADFPQTPQEIEEEDVNLSLQAAAVKHELDEAKETEAKEKDSQKLSSEHEHVLTLEKKLAAISSEKETLEKELQALKAQMAPQEKTPSPETGQPQIQPAPVAAPLPQEKPAALAPLPPPQPTTQPQSIDVSPTVRKIPADMAKSIGLPRMPDVANLIVGIVKDPRGNILQNILVEVKDKDGTPARAFRTNSLGQFASATPLSNGTYTLEFEDPKTVHRFDTVELVAKGEIMLPLEITSHDDREELRRALFS